MTTASQFINTFLNSSTSRPNTVRKTLFADSWFLGASMKDYPIMLTVTKLIELNTRGASPYKTH